MRAMNQSTICYIIAPGKSSLSGRGKDHTGGQSDCCVYHFIILPLKHCIKPYTIRPNIIALKVVLIRFANRDALVSTFRRAIIGWQLIILLYVSHQANPPHPEGENITWVAHVTVVGVGSLRDDSHQ